VLAAADPVWCLVEQFVPIADMPSGVQFSFFGSFEVGTPAYPISAIPFQQIIAKAEAGAYQAKPARVFGFEEIADAHRVMETDQAGGKLVIAGA
jgi:NADPH:quinone reductase